MNARQIIEDLTRSKFHQPENYDKVAEGAGWIVYAGCNDWEDAHTAMSVIFPSDEEARRVWITIKYPKDMEVDSGKSKHREDSVPALREYGNKAWKVWVKAAKAAHHGKNHGSRSWLDAFKKALHAKEMKDYVKDWGEDQTQWGEVPSTSL